MAEGALERFAGGPPLVVTLGGEVLDLGLVGPVGIDRGRHNAEERPRATTCSVILKAAALPVMPELGDALVVDLAGDLLDALAPVEATGLRGWATTPDTAAVSPTGDLDVRVRVAADDWAAVPWPAYLVNKGGVAYRLYMSAAALGFDWAGGGSRYASATSAAAYAGAATWAAALGWENGEPVWLRATLDADNGAGGATVVFSWSLDGSTWQTIATRTVAVVGGPTDTTNALAVGATTAGANRFPGVIYRAEVRSGIDGTVAAAPAFDDPAQWAAGDADGSTGTHDGALWTLGASSTIVAAPYPDLAAQAAIRRRFTGTVTNVSIRPSAEVVQIVAAGPKSRAARVPIGDVPWPQELDGERAERILDALVAADPSFVVLPGDPGTVAVLARDVDRQPAAALLDELAAYTGGDAWETRAGELVWRDARHRADVDPALTLDAGNVLVDPEFVKDLDGLVTDLTVRYGNPQAEVRVVDTAAQVQTLGASVTTPLATAEDAQAYAIEVVGRRSRGRWKVPALGLDVVKTLDPDQRLALLAGEPGMLVALTGMPTTAPFAASQLWVEGWREAYTRQSWRITLSVSPRGLTGAQARWIDVPLTYVPATTDPGQPPADPAPMDWAAEPFAGLSWIAVAGWWTDEETTLGRWADVPANVRWANYPTTTLWGDLA